MSFNFKKVSLGQKNPCEVTFQKNTGVLSFSKRSVAEFKVTDYKYITFYFDECREAVGMRLTQEEEEEEEGED